MTAQLLEEVFKLRASSCASWSALFETLEKESLNKAGMQDAVDFLLSPGWLAPLAEAAAYNSWRLQEQRGFKGVQRLKTHGMFGDAWGLGDVQADPA